MGVKHGEFLRILLRCHVHTSQVIVVVPNQQGSAMLSGGTDCPTTNGVIAARTAQTELLWKETCLNSVAIASFVPHR